MEMKPKDLYEKLDTEARNYYHTHGFLPVFFLSEEYIDLLSAYNLDSEGRVIAKKHAQRMYKNEPDALNSLTHLFDNFPVLMLMSNGYVFAKGDPQYTGSKCFIGINRYVYPSQEAYDKAIRILDAKEKNRKP